MNNSCWVSIISRNYSFYDSTVHTVYAFVIQYLIHEVKFVFMKDCLKTIPIRFYCVEALDMLFLVEEFLITSPLLFIINCVFTFK